MNSSLAIVQALTYSNQSIDSIDRNGNTALMLGNQLFWLFYVLLCLKNFSSVAVSLNKTDILEILLGANADYNKINNNGFNALKLGILFVIFFNLLMFKFDLSKQ